MSEVPSDAAAAELGKEEADLLFRSNKKAKSSANEQGSHAMDEVMTEQGVREVSMQLVPVESSTEGKEPASYRDSLVGMNGRDSAFTRDDDKIMDEDDLSDDDPEEDVAEKKDKPLPPGVDIPKARRARLCKPWRKSLIIKVLSKEVGFRFLANRIEKMWCSA